MSEKESRKQMICALLDEMIATLDQIIRLIWPILHEYGDCCCVSARAAHPPILLRDELAPAISDINACMQQCQYFKIAFLKDEFNPYPQEFCITSHTPEMVSHDLQLLNEQTDTFQRTVNHIQRRIFSPLTDPDGSLGQELYPLLFRLQKASDQFILLLHLIDSEYSKAYQDLINQYNAPGPSIDDIPIGSPRTLYGSADSNCKIIPSVPSHSRFAHSLESTNLAREYLESMKLAPPIRQEANLQAEIDEVQFRCAAPMVIKPGKYFTAKIMMYREDDTDRADKESAMVDDKVRMATSDVVDAEKGQEFTIRLQSPDLPELDESQQIRWNGKYAARVFQILLPKDYDKEQLRLLGRVYSDMAPLTDIRLILEICSPAPQDVRCEKLTLRTAFVSYASKDRAEVAKRLQLAQWLRMDIFFDRESLERGEEYEPRILREIGQRDLFLLFWSRNAAESEWVNKELTYALEHKPATQIEAFTLEAPEVCPPPEKLKHRHFWDWTMQYTT